MNLENLSQLVTEERNTDTLNLDKLETVDMLKLINNEDKKVAFAVEKSLGDIAKAVDVIAENMKKGGRLFYIGAGTSGRLGIVDASECPPTFGVDAELVQGLIAGGHGAVFKSVEGAEDNDELGKKDLVDKNLKSFDVVCGIAASGRTPYVLGGMRYAKEIGCPTISVTMNPNSEMTKVADYPISIVVGPEVLMGSTRMKAGTAQKMVLNMLTTGAMVKLGKVYSNLMVDVKASNEKLVVRAKRIVMLATGANENTAAKYLNETNYDVKLSIFMIISKLNKDKSKEILNKNDGYIQKALDDLDKENK